MDFLKLILCKMNLIFAIALNLQTFTPNQSESLSLLFLGCLVAALRSHQLVSFVLSDGQYLFFYLFPL